MMKKLVLFFLIPSAICAGQSVLTTPAQFGQSASGIPSAQVQPQVQPQPQTQVQAPDTRMPAAGPTVQDFANASGDTRAKPLSPSRIVGPLTTRSEFEQFAEDATGRRLPVYGRQLFDEVPTTFSPIEHVPVPSDYVIGPGDQLLIRAWGKIELDSRVTVDRNGQIYLPKVGALTVAGLHYDQVEGFLHSAIGAMFKDFQLNVALGQLRSIQIFVLGDARQPGVYTVSSLSTLVDALFACGGPSAIGTMRRIQLRRQGRTISEFDIYDLVGRGDKSHDVPLLPGDVIYIPPVGAQIAISGDVNQPGIYELKGETSIGAALQDAGGMTSLADAERAVLERIESHSNREIEEFALDTSGQERLLRDGDLLQVFPISPKFKNAVTLRGNVAQPGLYPWKEGMRISDLIPSRDFLVTRKYWNSENHLVPPISTHPFGIQSVDQYGNPQTNQFNNAQLDQSGNLITDQSGDVQTDQSSNPLTGQFGDAQTEQSGILRSHQLGSQRNIQSRTYRTPIIDTVGQNSAEINWDYALIERLDEHDLSTRLIPFRLADAIDNPASPDNQLLKPGDVVTIFSSADLALPMAKRALFVRVGGEVNAPGVYRMNPGDTLRDVVQRAGGLTQHSYLFASVLTRVSTRLAQEKELKQASEQMQKEIVSKYANASPSPGQTTADQEKQMTMQQAAIARISAIQPTGRIVLEMKPGAATIADIPNFPLENGDAFYIPPLSDTIQVSGAVYNVNAFRFEHGKRLRAYLDAAGGPTREADRKRIFVIRADGMVVSRQSRRSHSHGNFEKLVMFPGDAIVVPERFKYSNGLQNFANYAQIASGAAMTALTLGLLLP